MPDESATCAPVLRRMIEILGSEEKVTFVVAMKRAEKELDIVVPRHMETPLLLTAFEVIGSGKIPGLPEA